MGHYASEMMGGEEAAPEVAALRVTEARRAAEHSANYLWNELYPSYERNGAYIKPDEKLTCPTCFAEVKAALRQSHDEWHVKLKVSSGLFNVL